MLFAVLCAAASYIAVPAIQRLAIPEASPTLPLAASLGLTFSYNVTIGIPVYMEIAKAVIAASRSPDRLARAARISSMRFSQETCIEPMSSRLRRRDPRIRPVWHDESSSGRQFSGHVVSRPSSGESP